MSDALDKWSSATFVLRNCKISDEAREQEKQLADFLHWDAVIAMWDRIGKDFSVGFIVFAATGEKDEYSWFSCDFGNHDDIPEKLREECRIYMKGLQND